MQLTGLNQERVPVSLETAALLSGQNFYARASLDLNSSEGSLDSAFQVFVSDVEIPAPTRIDDQNLSLVFPAGLPIGQHDLTLVTPSGESDVLEDALLVAEPVLRIEDAGDGSGSRVESLQLGIGESVELFALSRWPDDQFFRAEVVSWTKTESGGSQQSSSSSLLVTGTAIDTISVVAQSALFGSATAQIQTAGCFTAQDCADPCRSTNACVGGSCVEGAVDKDADGDGFLDDACDGGTDCDDDPLVCGSDCFPGNGTDACDGDDNDCDSATDEDSIGTPTVCGVGACAGNTGTLSCVLGVETDSCDPLAGAAANDASCDNVDSDCDSAIDEDYLATATSCGQGACVGNTGTLSCVLGIESDSCDPLAGAGANDASCNNIDEDCDSSVDEDYVETPTTCGLGTCAGNVGLLSCIGGAESDSCDPLVGAATWFADADGDTFGNALSTQVSCEQPMGFVADDQDCADTPISDPLCGNLDGSFCNPGVAEGPAGDATCTDSVDNDCDGLVDGNDDGCTGGPVVVSNVDPDDFTPAGAVDLSACTGTVSFNSSTLAYSPNWCTHQPIPVEVNAGGVDVVVLPMDSLTLPDTVSIIFQGNRPIIALVYGDADLGGKIDAGGHGPLPGPGGSVQPCTQGQGDDGESGGSRAGGGGGGAFGADGGDGGRGQNGNFFGGPGGITEGNAELIPLRGGCSGGDGGVPGTGGQGPAGAGGGSLQISVTDTLTLSGAISAGGGGGRGGDTRRTGGGGGGSGGAILLEASTLIVTGFLAANGGAGGGGNGSNTGTTGPGADGSTAVTIPGGSGFETGGDGGNGGVTPTNEGSPGADDTSSGGGGGGGGGVGRIRLNANDCQLATATLSPQPTSNGGPGCP